jgi:hypothetical protein
MQKMNKVDNLGFSFKIYANILEISLNIDFDKKQRNEKLSFFLLDEMNIFILYDSLISSFIFTQMIRMFINNFLSNQSPYINHLEIYGSDECKNFALF